MLPHDIYVNEERAKEAATRERFLRTTPCKWRLVRAFDAVLRLLRVMLPTARVIEPTGAGPVSILVIEYWNLGDLAIVVPFLKNLRHRFPSARITLLIKAGLEPLLDGRGIVNEFIPIRVPWAMHFSRWKKYNPLSQNWISMVRTVRALRKRRFDWAFSGRMDLRDNFLLWLTCSRRRIGYSVGGGGSFLTDCVMPDFARPHRADVWLNLLQAVHVLPDCGLGGIQLADDELASARSYLAELDIPPNAFVIGVHPGARVANRRWGDERFAEIVRRLLCQNKVYILWFSEPGHSCQAPPWNRCHGVSLDLRSFLAVLSSCRLLVCNDSGPMHLANLLSVPVVAVFGPQRPEWFGPRGQRDRVVIRPGFWCRPCSDYCIFDQPYCLRTISIDEVHDAVKMVLRSDARKPERAASHSQMDRLSLLDSGLMTEPAAVRSGAQRSEI